MKLKTRPKYYYRSFTVVYILIFLWILYSTINGLPYGLFFVILMGFVSTYWISKAWEEWKKRK